MAPRLGELLLDKGSIAVAELHTALEACHRLGGRLGTHLLRFGFVEERDLLEALAQQFGVPSVTEAMLLKAPADLVMAIPLDVLRRTMAVPFDRHHGRLAVAMANPRDQAALDELAAAGGVAVEAFVSTDLAIERALETAVAEAVVGGDGQRRATAAVGAKAGDDWESLWKEPRVGPGEMLRCAVRPTAATGALMLASFPGLAPMLDVSLSHGMDELDEAGFTQQLQESRHRDDVGRALLRFVGAYCTRATVFALHHNRILGWLTRGEAVVLDDVQSFSVSLDEPSLFRAMNESGQPFLGALAPNPVNEALVRCLGDPAPLDVVAVPVRIKGRAAAFLVGDVPGERVADVPVRDIQRAADRAGVALEILILRSKIAS